MIQFYLPKDDINHQSKCNPWLRKVWDIRNEILLFYLFHFNFRNQKSRFLFDEWTPYADISV